MDIEERAEFMLGILEREQKKAAKQYAEMQLSWAQPICWPNLEELLNSLNIALEELGGTEQ